MTDWENDEKTKNLEKRILPIYIYIYIFIIILYYTILYMGESQKICIASPNVLIVYVTMAINSYFISGMTQ